MDGLKLSNKDFVFLSNDMGFLLLPLNYRSRYFGYFVRYKDYFIKILDNIKNKSRENKEIKEIILENSNKVKILYKDLIERYDLYDKKLVYEVNKTSILEPYFDIKHIYDVDEWNRLYSYEIKENYVRLSFSKGDINVNIYISGYIDLYEKEKKWEEFYYNFDEKRRSPPFKRWLYSPFTFIGKKLIISFDKNFKIKKRKEKFSLYKLLKERILSFSDGWISAGYPWYFQEWSRDVLISLKGIYLIGEKEIVKRKLLEYTKDMLECGKIKNITNFGNGNCDSILWYIKRLFDFKNLFTREEFESIISSIKRYFDNYLETSFDEEIGLIHCYPNESWMDTLNRKYPMEIQFLALNALENMYEYTKDNKYKEIYDKILNSIKKKYVSDNSLIDDIKNPSIRPNIFLSYYIYKKAFDKSSWEKYIDYSLRHLWLEWGGFSSISKFDTRFHEYHNGDNYFTSDKSMHNGDSWIYLNNIGAIVLNDLNKNKYSYYIEKIFESSTKYLKEIGTLPELSSAKERDISGAISQLWSLSTYVEMINEINKSIYDIEKMLK